MHFPIILDRPVTQPVAEVADNASQFRDASKRQPSTYVYRGELLEGLANDKRYRPQSNLQVAPQNRRAIDTYQNVANMRAVVGRVLDGFV